MEHGRSVSKIFLEAPASSVNDADAADDADFLSLGRFVLEVDSAATDGGGEGCTEFECVESTGEGGGAGSGEADTADGATVASIESGAPSEASGAGGVIPS